MNYSANPIEKKEKSLPLSVEYSTDNSRLDSLINSYLHYRYSHAYLHHNDVLRRNARVHDGCNALPDYSSGFRLYNFLSTKFPFLFDIILPINKLKLLFAVTQPFINSILIRKVKYRCPCIRHNHTIVGIKAKYLLPFAYNTENQKQLYDINTFSHQYRRNRHHHYTGDRTKYH